MTTISTVAAPTRQRLPFVVPLLAIGTFLMITTEYIVAGLLQEFAGDLHVSLAHTGLLITAFAIGMIVGSPVMALATLRLQRRATLVLALLVFAAGHIVAALSSDFVAVLIARAVTALAAGAFWSAASVVATHAAGPANSARALGVMMSGVGLATVAGVPLGSFAGQLVGWRGTFWALAALAVLAAPVIARFTPADAGRSTPSIRAELRAITNRRMALLVVATILATGGYMTAFSYLSPLATERAGVPSWAVPLVFVAFGLGAIVGTNLAGRCADRRPITTFIAATAGTVLLMALLVPLSTNTTAIFVLVFLLGIAGMGIPPVGTSLAVRFAHAAPTLAAAISVSAFNGGTAIGAWLGASALESTLGVVGPLTVAVILAVLGLLALLAMAVMRMTSNVED
ncbi:MFS transporter [Arthrobacter sp. 9MFCol3.1]|uniref:MFS transporter n=1 Tax=Arthrobacter sp. 9MFCol3.1 TaxID=1150398 RepID=UPI000686A7EA|nr:MFS transporter [Arthrobacter sp. 9MFCol3.1]